MKKILIALIIIVVAGTGFWLLWRNGKNSNLPPLETATVERGDLKVAVLATGTIQPYTRVEVSSAVRGRIDRVEAEEGDRVQKGDTLAWVSSDERIALIEAARSALYADSQVARAVTGQFNMSGDDSKVRLAVQLRPGREPGARLAAPLARRLGEIVEVSLVSYRDYPHGMEVDYERKFRHIS